MAAPRRSLKGTLFHHLVNIPTVPTDNLYKQMITSDGSMNPFLSTDESIGETVSVWTLFSMQEST